MRKSKKIHELKFLRSSVITDDNFKSIQENEHSRGLGKTEEPNVFIQDNRPSTLSPDIEPLYYKVDFEVHDEKSDPNMDFVVVYSIDGINLLGLKQQIVSSKQKECLKSVDQFDIVKITPISEESKEKLMTAFHS